MSLFHQLIQQITRYDTRFWKHSLLGIYSMAGLAFIGISLGMPTGLGLWFDIPMFTMVCIILTVMGSYLAAGLLTLIRIPLPRLFIGGIICNYLVFSFTLVEFNMSYLAGAVSAVVLLSLGFLIGSSLSVARKMRFGLSNGMMRNGYAGIAICLLLFFLIWLFRPGVEVYPVSAHLNEMAMQHQITQITSDPSQEGKYDYKEFTYGSGSDRHRPEFNTKADFITDSVDASFISDWPLHRKVFWGFDQHHLPLNGRVWMPVGRGPFPLVIIVHGSHEMEQFSDAGYAYLGKQLASHGFIAISVDENFINYSVWSGGIDWDMTTRAWILLQHIKMLQSANIAGDTPFTDKINMDNIVLIGHSRGGQAAALAANFQQLYNHSNHKEISVSIDFKIKAVVAISPTDKPLDNQYIRLKDINYLLLQGAQDSDVNTYSGNRQYDRVQFSGKDYKFKASVYIEGANHGQFNTDWGDSDISMPTSLLLNKTEIMDAALQRRIAKAYITAFLEVAIHGEPTYLPMLRDYRTASSILPATGYINRFEDSDFLKISNYEEDKNISTTSVKSGTFLSHHLKLKEQDIKNRENYSTGNHAVYLEWDGSGQGSYSIRLPKDYARKKEINADAKFMFSLANAHTKDQDEAEATNENEVPQITIEMLSSNGQTVRYPLSRFREIPPIIHSRFMKLDFLEDELSGGVGDSSETVFQTFEVPLRDFTKASSRFQPEDLILIRWLFEEGSPGKIYIDEIGFEP